MEHAIKRGFKRGFKRGYIRGGGLRAPKPKRSERKSRSHFACSVHFVHSLNSKPKDVAQKKPRLTLGGQPQIVLGGLILRSKPF